ncbi:uncharacterized protein I303_104811 [Kwoniella dejecticola CBS 10117]|uniref:Uncharacterized protein n=1 Tax=Kwoniella dejecticola CBS 10117 TaxID=1296121 RepID=A0A1A6A4A2_9TREE|nr:uncharacterized protein I303_04208 [Kwoniella dejecticola CBS 10117]OBR84886.1 hypothetical protein I303_04208 [Kwoniella dejecticola CBS 10117]
MFRQRHHQFSPSTSSSPPRSSTPELEMPGRASTITPSTIYSDDATEVPAIHYPKEGKLIDFENDNENEYEGELENDEQVGEEEGQNPGDKLRELLNQMRQAVEVSKPTSIPQESFSSSSSRLKSDWRKSLYGAQALNEAQGEGEVAQAGPSSPRRRNRNRYFTEERSEEDENQGNAADEDDEEEEEQSPPTPPPRIINPYSRRGDRRSSPNLSQPSRLPSRAAVLLNSTSRLPPSPDRKQSSNHQRDSQSKSPPTRLEAFLASSTSSLPPHPHPGSHPERSYGETSTAARLRSSLERRGSESSTSSSRSRKGKERDHRSFSPIQPTQPAHQEDASERRSVTDIRRRYRNTPPPEETSETRRSRIPPTPRRISVDLAPDDLHSFARNAVDLEVRGEVELDLDEGLSAVGWEESSQSLIGEGEEEEEEVPLRQVTGRNDSPEQSGRRINRSSTVTPNPPQSQSPSTRRQSLNNNKESSSTYASNMSKRQDSPPTDSPPLPALPEPEISEEDDISEIDTYSSRRAALFRSTSKSLSVSQSQSQSQSLSHSRSNTIRDRSNTPSTSFGTPASYSSRSRISVPRTVEKEKKEKDASSVQEEFSSKRDINRYTRSPELESATQQDSPARSPRTSLRQSHSAYRSAEDIPIPPQDPVQVNIALPSQPESPSPLKSATPDPSTSASPEPASLSVHNRHTQGSSTPLRSNNPNLSAMPTPKPPGAWQSTPNKSRVRFNPSPLGKMSPSTSTSISPGDTSHKLSEAQAGGQAQENEGVSIHRLRVSPRRSPKSKINIDSSQKSQTQDDVEVGNESFLGRLKESFGSPLKRSLLNIPAKSTTFTLHTTSIENAKSATLAAEQALLITQKQWLEALQSLSTAAASASGNSIAVGQAVKKGWGWGTWVLWGLVEVVVLWSVFRMTIDYATSLNHLSTLDPFHPLALPFNLNPRTTATDPVKWGYGPFGSANPIKLDFPIPGRLQTLVGGGNANLFDMMESWGMWGSVKYAGPGGSASAGARGLGGVPS